MGLVADLDRETQTPNSDLVNAQFAVVPFALLVVELSAVLSVAFRGADRRVGFVVSKHDRKVTIPSGFAKFFLPSQRWNDQKQDPGGEWDRISVFELPPSETPSTKPQAPEKFQISKHQTPKTDAGANGAGRFLSLELGASLELGVWILELVAWALFGQQSFDFAMRPPIT